MQNGPRFIYWSQNLTMYNKFLILFISLSQFITTLAQTSYSQVNYTFIIGHTSQLDCKLIHSNIDNTSTFVNLGFRELPDSTYTTNTDVYGDKHVNSVKYSDDGGQNPEYQKYFDKDSLYSYEKVYGEKSYAVISEKLPHFRWEIGQETKEILGHQTQKATTEFRGRKYEAWFASDIKISDGPYKFSGLPGMILEIASHDGKYQFIAYELKINQEKVDSEIEPLSKKHKNSKKYDIYTKLKIIEENEKKEIKYQLSKNPNISEFKVNNSGIEIDFSDLYD